MSEPIPVGTLVRVNPSSGFRNIIVRDHGYLWLVDGYNYGDIRLKSVATGHKKTLFNLGIEPFEEQTEEQTDE